MNLTRRGLFGLIGAAIAGRRCNRALRRYVSQELRVGDRITIAGTFKVNPPIRLEPPIQRFEIQWSDKDFAA